MALKPVPDTHTWGRQQAKARYQPAKNSQVSPAPSEHSPQFPDEQIADHVDVGHNEWTRGGGKDAPHPAFDAGPSGHTYGKKGK